MSTMTTTTIRHPEINVQMVGEDGNAFAILGRVQKALRAQGCDATEVKTFFDEATAGDYDHLLRTVLQWVSVDQDSDEDDEEEPTCEQCGCYVSKWDDLCDNCFADQELEEDE